VAVRAEREVGAVAELPRHVDDAATFVEQERGEAVAYVVRPRVVQSDTGREIFTGTVGK
jgi:hypothetical protein